MGFIELIPFGNICILIRVAGTAQSMGNFKLYKVVYSSMKWQLLSPIPARLTLIGFTILQPLLLNSFLSYLEEPEAPNSANHGYGFMVAYAVVYSGIAVRFANTGLLLN